MSVERCPSCGRTWDGSLCFACGHERGKAVRAAAPPVVVPSASPAAPTVPLTTTPAPLVPPPITSIPAPSAQNPFGAAAAPRPPPVPAAALARSPTPGPHFAPLPALPPLGRPPTQGGMPGVGRSPTQGGVPGVGLPAPFASNPLPPPPSFSPSPAPSFAPAPFSPSPAPMPAPFSATPPPPQVFGRDTQPAGFPAPMPPMPNAIPSSPLPPLPPVQSRQPQPALVRPPRAEPAFNRPAPAGAAHFGGLGADPDQPLPSSAAAAASNYDDNEQTADGVATDRPPRWQVYARRLYVSKAAFAAAFALGFVFTFLPGALIWCRTPSTSDLLAQRRYGDVIDQLRAKKDAGHMAPDDWVIYGHALERQYGRLRWDDMLQMYQMAATEKRVDATALDNTIAALEDKDRQKRAVEVLAVWPDSKDDRLDPTRRLAQRAADESFAIRHGALDALRARNAPPELVDDAVAAAALADLKAKSCVDHATFRGVQDIDALIASKSGSARVALSRHNPFDALNELADQSTAQNACVDPNAVSRALTHFASLNLR